MDPDRPAHAEPLPPNALHYLQFGAAAYALAGVVAVALVSKLALKLDGNGLGFVIAALTVVAFASALIGPRIIFKRWWYAISDEQIDIGHGIWIAHHVAIPAVRVQYVDIGSGPILNLLNLKSLSLSTAAGSHKIPGLPVGLAHSLQQRIAAVARVPDEL